MKKTQKKRNQISAAKKAAKESRRRKAIKRKQGKCNAHFQQQSMYGYNTFSSTKITQKPQYVLMTDIDENQNLPFQKEIKECLVNCLYSQCSEDTHSYDFSVMNVVNGTNYYIRPSKIVESENGDRSIQINYLNSRGEYLSESSKLTHSQSLDYAQNMSGKTDAIFHFLSMFTRESPSETLLRPILTIASERKEPLVCPFEDEEESKIIKTEEIHQPYIISKGYSDFTLFWGTPKEMITKIGCELAKDQSTYDIVIGNKDVKISWPYCFYEKSISALYFFLKIVVDGIPEIQVFPVEITTDIDFPAKDDEFDSAIYKTLMVSQENYSEFLHEIETGERNNNYKTINDFLTELWDYDATNIPINCSLMFAQ